MAHPTGPAKDPFAAVWKHAEDSLSYRIHAVHETGVTIDRSRHHLHWEGAAADRFVARAKRRHTSLHQHNDDLRHLLSQIRRAAEMAVADAKPATPTTAPATASPVLASAPVAAPVPAATDPITDPAPGVDPDADPDDTTDDDTVGEVA